MELVCIKEGEEPRDFCRLVGDCSCYTSLLKGEKWLCASMTYMCSCDFLCDIHLRIHIHVHTCRYMYVHVYQGH